MNRVCHPKRRPAFTLIELLTVVIIISLVATLTLAAYRAIAADSRVSMAVNTVRASLDNARAMAIELNRRTMVVFRPVLTGPESQQVEALIAVETGEAHLNPFATLVIDWYTDQQEQMVGLRFEPLDGVESRLLPKGMMVASPVYSLSTRSGNPDEAGRDEWMTLSYLPAMDGGGQHEAPGVVLGIIFDRSGAMRATFTDTGAQMAFVDFNGDGRMQCDGSSYSLMPDPDGAYVVPEPGVDFNCVFSNEADPDDPNLNYCHSLPDDEPYVLIAPYFALFDFDEAREEYGGQDRWGSPSFRLLDLDEFIREHGREFHFNKFTGVTSQ